MSSNDDSTDQSENGQAGQSGRSGQTAEQTGGQPAGQPGQPSQGGQTGQVGGHTPPTARSATDVLSEPAGQAVLKYVVGAFAILGAGFGFGGLLIVNQLSTTVSFGGFSATTSGFVAPAIGVPLFGGPILAALFAHSGIMNVGQQETETYLVGFASTAAGYLVMGLLALLLLSISDATGGLSVGDFVVPLIIGAIITGAVAAGICRLDDWAGIDG